MPERGEELRFVRAGERRIEHRILETLDGSTKNDSSAVDSGGAGPGGFWGGWNAKSMIRGDRIGRPARAPALDGLRRRGQSLPGPASVPACYAGSASTSLDPAPAMAVVEVRRRPRVRDSVRALLDGPAMAVVEVRRHSLTADGFARMGEAGTFAGDDRGELEKAFGIRP